MTTDPSKLADDIECRLNHRRGMWTLSPDELRTIVAALRQSAPGWLPIETAPKDRSILLYTKYGVTYCGRWRRAEMGEPWSGSVEWRCDSSGRFATPTHWQPLPAPPADGDQNV